MILLYIMNACCALSFAAGGALTGLPAVAPVPLSTASAAARPTLPHAWHTGELNTYCNSTNRSAIASHVAPLGGLRCTRHQHPLRKSRPCCKSRHARQCDICCCCAVYEPCPPLPCTVPAHQVDNLQGVPHLLLEGDVQVCLSLCLWNDHLRHFLRGRTAGRLRPAC